MNRGRPSRKHAARQNKRAISSPLFKRYSSRQTRKPQRTRIDQLSFSWRIGSQVVARTHILRSGRPLAWQRRSALHAFRALALDENRIESFIYAAAAWRSSLSGGAASRSSGAGQSNTFFFRFHAVDMATMRGVQLRFMARARAHPAEIVFERRPPIAVVGNVTEQPVDATCVSNLGSPIFFVLVRSKNRPGFRTVSY